MLTVTIIVSSNCGAFMFNLLWAGRPAGAQPAAVKAEEAGDIAAAYYGVAGYMAMDWTTISMWPVLTTLQFPPPFVLLNTPPPSVLA